MAGPLATQAAWPETLPGFEGISRSWHPGFERCVAKITPGQYYVTQSDEVISTVLGSCVSACIRDPLTGIGGMNHFMLPGSASPDRPADGRLEERYGVAAMESLINEILKQGARKRTLEVKLFGGGSVLDMETQRIGERNVEFVREFARVERLVVTAEDLGGEHGRKILYFPKTGRVLLRRLQSATCRRVVDSERRYVGTLQQPAPRNDICLFD